MSDEPEQRIEPVSYTPAAEKTSSAQLPLVLGLLAVVLAVTWWYTTKPGSQTVAVTGSDSPPPLSSQNRAEDQLPEADSARTETPAETPAELPTPPPVALLAVSSTPTGASVAVDGSYQGQTPLTLELPGVAPVKLLLSRSGYQSVERRVAGVAGQSKSLDVTLEPVLGRIDLDIEPSGAKIFVDGDPRSGPRLELPAKPHRLRVTKAGFVDFEETITPDPEYAQRLTVRLKSEQLDRLAATPARIESGTGIPLLLIQPSSFTMGTRRGTQGRQSNETLRPVKLTRAYYMSAYEISNAQFRRFDPRHSSGIAHRRTLDNDKQPVVRVSWLLAVRYCNWLSEQDGLEPAYAIRGQSAKLITPQTNGYRLPSEAEWAHAARFAGQAEPLRYPWGGAMPPTAGAGNFADRSARGLVERHLTDYDDGYPVSAAVGAFSANAIGIYDLGGNVSEWVHDFDAPPEPVMASEVTDPFGPESGTDHVIRGSSWQHGRITQLRLAWRDRESQAREDLGFRIARYALPVTASTAGGADDESTK